MEEGQLEYIPPALQQMTKAETETQVDIAKRYPRSLQVVRAKVLELATLDQETAIACFYSLPRGGRTVSGESVRLAEILVGCYQNLRVGTRVVETDLVRGMVTSQGVCFDVENNVQITVEKQRKIQKKRSAAAADPYDDDMITLTANANSAIAFRDAVFKTVPKALIKPILGQIKEAARGKGTMDEKRAGVFNRFKELYSLDEKRVLQAVECATMADVGLDVLDTLIGMGTALKDGEYTVEDLFPKKKQVVKKAKVDPHINVDHIVQSDIAATEVSGRGSASPATPKVPASSAEEVIAGAGKEPEEGPDEIPMGDSEPEEVEEQEDGGDKAMPDALCKTAFKKALKENKVTIASFVKWADENKFGSADSWTAEVMATFIESMPKIAEQLASK